MNAQRSSLGDDRCDVGDFRDFVCPSDAALVLTDPPYGLGKTYDDVKETRAFHEWVCDIYEWNTAPRMMLFAPTPTIHEWMPAIPKPSRMLWWHRTFVQPSKGLSWWVASLTPILVYESENAPWHGPTKNDRTWHDVIDSHSSMADLPRLKRLEAPKHPGVTGTQIVKKILPGVTVEGDLVVDAMAGLGSVLAASLMLDRRAYGIEIAPEYAATANRWIGSLVTVKAAA
jgi:predicted RNA methylase